MADRQPVQEPTADALTMERLLRAAWREVADLRALLGMNPDFNTVPAGIAREALRHGNQ